ncbi:MAG: hypothetical protein JNL77_03135 [Nitrosomonas sp.]|nr:hypothetical protein [Nitrosomonas sp.]
MILIKYKDIKILVNADSDVAEFIKHKDKIVALNAATTEFAENLLKQTDNDVKRIACMKKELESFVLMSDAIGFPLNNKDAELYALDKHINYDVIELSDS